MQRSMSRPPPADTNCPCCKKPMHVIGEETSERLDVIPAQYRVIITHRPRLACVQRQRPQRIDIVGERIQPTVSRAKHSTLQAICQGQTGA